MEKNNPTDLSCKNCAYPLEAYPPDAIYSIPMIERCLDCRWGSDRSIKRDHECSHCDVINTIYWHNTIPHTKEEKNVAKYNERNFLKRLGGKKLEI